MTTSHHNSFVGILNAYPSFHNAFVLGNRGWTWKIPIKDIGISLYCFHICHYCSSARYENNMEDVCIRKMAVGHYLVQGLEFSMLILHSSTLTYCGIWDKHGEYRMLLLGGSLIIDADSVYIYSSLSHLSVTMAWIQIRQWHFHTHIHVCTCEAVTFFL